MPVNFISCEGSMNEKLENTYTTNWQVIGTSTFGPIEAINAVGIGLYDAYNVTTEFDTTALCKQRVATPVADDKGRSDLKQYDVVITYGRVEITNDNPFQAPVKVNISTNTIDEPVDFSITGDAIVNTAGEAFAEAVNRARPQSVISFTRNEPGYDLSLTTNYTACVNLYPWNGVPKGMVMLNARNAVEVFNQNYGYYYEVSYEFAINLNGYKKKILNQGLRQLNWVPKQLSACFDDDWTPVTSPVLLDRSGKQAVKNATPIFLEFEVYQYADFNIFGF